MTPERCEKCVCGKVLDHHYRKTSEPEVWLCEPHEDAQRFTPAQSVLCVNCGKPRERHTAEKGYCVKADPALPHGARFTPARDGREGQEQIGWACCQCDLLVTSADGDYDEKPPKECPRCTFGEFKVATVPSPVQPQPGWRALGPEEVIQNAWYWANEVEYAVKPFGNFSLIDVIYVGTKPSMFPHLQFRRREGGEKKEPEGTMPALPEDELAIGGTAYCERCQKEVYPDKVCKCEPTKAQPVVVSTLDLIAENRNLKGQIFSLRARLAEVERKAADWKADYEACKIRSNEWQEKHKLINESLADIVPERDRLRAEIAALREERDKALGRIDHLADIGSAGRCKNCDFVHNHLTLHNGVCESCRDLEVAELREQSKEAK